MDKYERAEQLLKEKVEKCEFGDEVYTLVHNLVSICISEVETQVEGLHDEDESDDVEWYDFVHEDMMQILFKRIGKWLLS